MKRKNSLLLVLFLMLAINGSAQEKAPLKTFEFSISLNKLKTQEQAQSIQQEVSTLKGVKDCGLVLVEYNLTFSCTNHDMNDYMILDRVKVIVVENGAEIVKINRKER
ncbi:hypothetical protein K6119_13930 [Paracrocinitomix mangrovi]|uniref:hypothetical protein n=1 Tax=Paracrocinitomix mangrovi TaxID=2862509 RepID=UPI001C8DBCB8|nr:hypothetical protein [Paracrocinitomix mangrovi]UKN00829.1 hypothetical protein K6119_13930 [Paracrocinitomix mangrovi]